MPDHQVCWSVSASCLFGDETSGARVVRTGSCRIYLLRSSIERSFAWTTRFRRLAKDYERLPEIVAGLHFVAFACLFLHRAVAPGADP